MISASDYSDLFDRLEADKVRYVVVSGAAVVLRGYVRPIVDLDIVIDPAPDEAGRAMQVLLATGFVPTIPLPLSAVTVLRMFDAAEREVDVFVRYHIPFDQLWSVSEILHLNDSLVRVMSVEHLIQVKRINGRPHDLEDIKGLLAATQE